jgi:hypothetical protein
MHAGYIEQHARFQLLLVKPVLHQIADADDALQLVVLDLRQMADPRRAIVASTASSRSRSDT